MTHDRNYLRMLSDYALWNYVADRGTTELEFVMAERLYELNEQIVELEQLQTLYDRLVAENNALRDDMAE